MNLSVAYFDAPLITREQIQANSEAIQNFSETDYVIDGKTGKNYATLEYRGWRLDGESELIGDSLQGYWWSEKPSDENGMLERPAVLTMRMEEPVSATGLTFTFGLFADQWCSRVRVSWYSGTQLLLQDEFFPDKKRWILQQKVEGFDAVRVELLQTDEPYRFAKMERLELGQVWRFQEADLISAELESNFDPTLSSLMIDTMRIKVHTPPGAVLLPQEDQRLELRYEDLPVVTHYLTGSCRESRDVYTLQAQSAVGLLRERFLGGLYPGLPVKDLLDRIFGDQRYILDSRLKDKTILGYLPVCTQREALQQVALAVGAVVTTTEDGICCLCPILQAEKHEFPENTIFQGATLANRRRYSKVEVAAHTYEMAEQLRMLLDEEPVYGTQLFLFNKPYHDYFITGGQIVESDVNYVWIKAQGPVTLQGREHLHTTQIHSKSDSLVVGNERQNVFQVLDATLVSHRNVEAVLQQQYEVARLWQTLEMEAVDSTLLAGRKAIATTPWSSMVQGYIASMKTRFSGQGQVAKVKLMGMEMEQDV